MPRSRTRWLFTASVLLMIVGLSTFTVQKFLAAANPGPREEQWKKVEQAENKGLPKSAIAELEPIIASAMRDKAYPEALKAISKKIALEGVIQGNHPEERITRLAAEIAQAPAEMRPMMHAILANWYWHYFQHNRWRFMQRTQTAAADGTDIKTWSLPRVFQEIDKQFTIALEHEKTLKATPVSAYAALLQKGTVSDVYRPTLWDFLAFNALAFYTASEQAGAQPEDAWEPEAGGPILAPLNDFLKWNPNPSDTTSRKLKAVRLYQNLLAFHHDDQDRTAQLDADLHRLQFGYNAAFGPEKSGRYKAALQDYIAKWGDHELAAVARFRFATLLNEEGEKVEAKKQAEEGVQAFPESYGGRLCFNLIKQIEAPYVELVTERIWAKPLPPVRVKYRNVTTLHFRAYKADWMQRIGRQQWRPEQLNETERQALLAKAPEHAWTATLPATADYQDRVEDTPAPKNLPPGFYFLFASPDVDFQHNQQPIFTTDFWVSDLAIVMRNREGGRGVEGFVLKAETGEPITGAKIRTWTRSRQGKFDASADGTTNENGLFSLPGNPNQAWIVLAEHQGQSLGSGNDLYSYWSNHTRPHNQAVLFTDRAIYRPGQIVRFKGIVLHVNQDKDDYKTLAKQSITVEFLDPNGKPIDKIEAKSNEFGSFSGSFTAPRDRLSGAMSLQARGAATGYARVQVEEYKRPQFLVELEDPKSPAKLGGDVTLIGKAMAYTGVTIGGAKVRYRVVREVRFAPWIYQFCWWRLPPNRGATQEIAHGSALTNADGSFPITFPAKPDQTVAEKDEPTFVYTVTADVTDTTGETRTGSQSVTVGYTALAATVTTPDWLSSDQPQKLTVTTNTHDGVPQAVKGVVKVYAVQQPAKVMRPDILNQPNHRPWRGRMGKPPVDDPTPDPTNPMGWAEGKVVATLPFTTQKDGTVTLTAKLPVGLYRAVVETQDAFDKPVSAKTQFTVVDPNAKQFAIRIPNLIAAPQWTLEPGETFSGIWGTGYDKGRAYIEVEHHGIILKSFWTDANRTLATIAQPVTEAMRGGFTVRVTYVRENRAYLESRIVQVPWTNKQLNVRWERFVSKLEPGAKEKWTALITGSDAKTAAAEMVATLYDASLDQFLKHLWPGQFQVFRQERSPRFSHFENMAKHLHQASGIWTNHTKSVPNVAYRSFPADVIQDLWGYQYLRKGAPEAMMMHRGATGGGALEAPAPTAARAFGAADEAKAANQAVEKDKQFSDRTDAADTPKPNLDQVAARTNLAETAFFFPHLVSDKDGVVRMEFTMPEALTKWKFMGFAHDRVLRSGTLTGETVTAKDLMVRPNPPRFLREGDILEFTVKISNQSDARQVGNTRLTLTDARTGQPITANLGVTTPELTFDVPPKESRTLSWRLTVPNGQGPVIYKAVGATDKLSDGEEGFLPVLSKRVLVSESLPLPIRGKETKTFDFAKLKNSADSATLQTQSLTVQMTSNPAWYAVMALPYLMEYPYECSEQTFNRLYANALARHVAISDPKIRKIFDQWKNTPALESPLQKNQDLKAILLAETPWVNDAEKESQARRNVGILFDEVRLRDETSRLLGKLADMQHADGAWPWFPGGPANDYITLYITTGFGRMRHLGTQVNIDPAIKSLARLDGWVTESYNKLQHKEKNNLNPTIALYLYGRSFFLKDLSIADQHREAVNYWLGQAKKHWLDLANRQSQAHLALALHRWNDKATATAIVNSIRERSVADEELGMFWRETELSLWWYRAPIETQAMMIELFDEVAQDKKAVEECKIWLLKQKQTRDWKTTKATADAVYALLLRGTGLLASDALVEVKLGGEKVTPDLVEAGTGFYEQKFIRQEVTPDMGTITVTKTDKGVAWGGVHWQYLEDISKVTPHEGTPLKLEKRLFKRTFTKSGPVLEPIRGTVLVGDEIVVRVVLRTDRDMEYIHLKDHRGSGTEPVNVLSKYKYQDGLSYYESTRDTSTDFFIDYLPKGTYVFEYPIRVQHKGKYPSGLASVQCLYAPEFNSHSASTMIEAR
ncbi:MAG: hypothetical protein LC104_02030 [Bacteroidales bacterium]|nr:hypothetical protein [Bacteroidales bacterium]